jgi:hypothetical protein
MEPANKLPSIMYFFLALEIPIPSTLAIDENTMQTMIDAKLPPIALTEAYNPPSSKSRDCHYRSLQKYSLLLPPKKQITKPTRFHHHHDGQQ